MTASGLRRALLRSTERVSCALATRVLAVSRSMRDEAVRSGLVRAEKIDVLLGGTANGIDAALFAPATAQQRAAARRSAGIPADARVIGFVGRLVGDKGVRELVEAWGRIREQFPDAHLLLVGGVEERDAVPPATLARIRGDARVHETGWLDDPRPLYAAMDLLALPSYREGFPTVPLEAAACGLPVVATRVPGCTDAVEDGVTGVLVPLRDPDLRRAHGRAGRERVARDFGQEALWEAIDAEYRALLRRPRQRGAALAAKRALDVTAAALGLAATAPLLAAVAAALRATTGGPALFVQERPGRGGRPFRLVKFRTMTDARDAAGRLLPDAERLTRVGRLLRATSLDELPQLWNVLRGDLSLVGPRPLLVQYLARYTPEQARRHEVLPGITGWAQIHGRNAIGWDERFALDVWYVDHWSLGLDLLILARTVGSVLRRHGISQEGHATMPEFMGSGAEDGR
jgi:lipopolysaccharide/colanic/teichoic acid biosynthesis glycosyltransferase